jgi:hypothetical protein
VIEKWYKKEGDLIKKDEVICDIRTEVSGLSFSNIEATFTQDPFNLHSLLLFFSYSRLEC